MSEVKMARFDAARKCTCPACTHAHTHILGMGTCMALHAPVAHACTQGTCMTLHAPVARACLQGGFEVPRRGVIAAVQPTGSEVVLMLVR